MKSLSALAALSGLLAGISFAGPVHNHTILNRQVKEGMIKESFAGPVHNHTILNRQVKEGMLKKYMEVCVVKVTQYIKPRPGIDNYVLDVELKWQERAMVSILSLSFPLVDRETRACLAPEKNKIILLNAHFGEIARGETSI